VGVRVSPVGLECWQGVGEGVSLAGASRDGAAGSCQLRRCRGMGGTRGAARQKAEGPMEAGGAPTGVRKTSC